MNYLKDLKTLELGVFKEAAKTLTPLSLSQLESLYAAAYGLYEVGSYKEAADLFTFLTLQDPFESRFWKGVAGSLQMHQEFKASLHAWGIVCILEKHAPLPHFHAGECLVSLGDKENALKALDSAQKKLAQEDPLFEKIETLKERIHSHG